MKTLLAGTILFIVIPFIFNSYNSDEPASKLITIDKSLFTSTLDSIQGTWHNEDDVNSKISISGNLLTEHYLGITGNKTYRLYFTDVEITEDDFLNVNTNLLSTSGRYLIKVSETTNTVWCYYIHNIYLDLESVFTIIDNEIPHKRLVYIKE